MGTDLRRLGCSLIILSTILLYLARSLVRAGVLLKLFIVWLAWGGSLCGCACRAGVRVVRACVSREFVARSVETFHRVARMVWLARAGVRVCGRACRLLGRSLACLCARAVVGCCWLALRACVSLARPLARAVVG